MGLQKAVKPGFHNLSTGGGVAGTDVGPGA